MTSCFPVLAPAASKGCLRRAGESNLPPAYGWTLAVSLVLNWSAPCAVVHGLGPTQHIDAVAVGIPAPAAAVARRALLSIPTRMFAVLFVMQLGSLTPSNMLIASRPI